MENNLKDQHYKNMGITLQMETLTFEAESVAYVVCQYLGVDTSDYTFGYIAGWSKKRELPELKSALDTIRKAAAELIEGLEVREIVPQKTILPQPKKYDRAPVR